jgi:hypothetical protein
MRMVQAVHDGISPRAQIGRALCDPGQNEEHFFPEGRHLKGAMRCIPVHEHGLERKGQIPMGNEEDKYGHIYAFVK